jgi:hypothetical protein
VVRLLFVISKFVPVDLCQGGFFRSPSAPEEVFAKPKDSVRLDRKIRVKWEKMNFWLKTNTFLRASGLDGTGPWITFFLRRQKFLLQRHKPPTSLEKIPRIDQI